jgi:hypothetical protein
MAKISDKHGNVYYETARFRGMVDRSNGYASCFHTKDPIANIWTVGPEYSYPAGSTYGATASYGAMADYQTYGPTGLAITVDHTCDGPPVA